MKLNSTGAAVGVAAATKLRLTWNSLPRNETLCESCEQLTGSAKAQATCFY